MLSKQVLETLFTDLESDRVERKRSEKQSEAIRKNICAFANDLPDSGRAGVIFVGVEDDGSCSKLPITDKLMLDLSQVVVDS